MSPTVRIVLVHVGILTLLSAASLVAQSKPRARPAVATASIEGDVYLVMQSGDTKRGAGRTVYLLTDSMREPLAVACSTYSARHKQISDSMDVVQSLAKQASDAAYEASLSDITNRSKRERWDALSARYIQTLTEESNLKSGLTSATILVVRQILLGFISDTVGTGMNAHYRFPKVKPGKYVLWSEWDIGSNNYQWWAPLTLKSGDVIKRDLDNSVEANNALYCGLQ